jgi:Fe-S cluster biogenesis protein NfuA
MADSTKRPKATETAAETAAASGAATAEDAAFRERVDRVLARIRPAVQEDGGDLELVSASIDGLVRIRLHGACVGCPSAHQTLHHGIERTLRGELGPTIRVEAVE